jgi:hypothetical protein
MMLNVPISEGHAGDVLALGLRLRHSCDEYIFLFGRVVLLDAPLANPTSVHTLTESVQCQP